MALNSVDFTSYYLTNVLPSQAQALAATGVQLAQIGFDSSAASGRALSSILGAGIIWDAYRFLYWNYDVSQVQSCIDGIHDFTPDAQHLPTYCFFDAEENTGPGGVITYRSPSNAADYFHRLADYVESKGITANDLVKPGIYTRKDWWESYCAGYTELAERGWVLWSSEPGDGSTPNTAALYGGWQRNQMVGVQNSLNIQSPIGPVDGSQFRDRNGNAPIPDPPVLTVVSLAANYSDGSSKLYVPQTGVGV